MSPLVNNLCMILDEKSQLGDIRKSRGRGRRGKGGKHSVRSGWIHVESLLYSIGRPVKCK